MLKSLLLLASAPSIHTRRWAEYYRDRGVRVHVASFQPGSIDGVDVHALPTWGLGKLGYVLAAPLVRSLVRKVDADLTHAHYVTSYGFVGALAQVHPFVVTAWGSDVLLVTRQSRIMRRLAAYAVRSADAVTTVADHMNAAVIDLGARADAVSAIPFGVDSNRFVMGHPTPTRGRPWRLICTRNFAPVYDISTFLRAVAELAREGVSLHVDLVGKGPLRPALEQEAAGLGIARICTFHGHVEPERLVQFLGEADVFVSPSLSDGNNVSLNEAMSCGAFPVATRIPANVQWITERSNGLLYEAGVAAELAACLRLAFADGELRFRARQINREIVVTRASWDAACRRMDKIYELVLGKRPDRSRK